MIVVCFNLIVGVLTVIIIVHVIRNRFFAISDN